MYAQNLSLKTPAVSNSEGAFSAFGAAVDALLEVMPGSSQGLSWEWRVLGRRLKFLTPSVIPIALTSVVISFWMASMRVFWLLWKGDHELHSYIRTETLFH